jgi:transposase
LNVLKPHPQVTIATLLELGASQHEIARRTGVDRKTIRRYTQTANSPMATGAQALEAQIPAPRPPAPSPAPVRSACEAHRR